MSDLQMSVQRPTTLNEPGDGSLWVEFIGEITVIEQHMSFGRCADLVLDDGNPFMHRTVGAFEFEAGAWWIHNRAGAHPMVIFGSDGLRVVLPAGTSASLGAHTGTVSFTSGPTPYELTYVTSDAPRRADRQHISSGSATAQFARPLHGELLAVLLEFAGPWFSGAGVVTPTYAEVAQRLGLRRKSIDHALTSIRSELRDSGVVGIDTIEGLVTYLVSTGRLTMTHFEAIRPTH